MQATFDKLRWAFMGLFALAVIAVWTYQIGWAAPRQKCEASGRWWSDEDRLCATPIAVSVFTGKPSPGEPAGALVRGPRGPDTPPSPSRPSQGR